MIGEKSLYSKIFYVLEIAKKKKAKEVLYDALVSENSPVFFTMQYNKRKGEFEPRLSLKSISKTLGFIRRTLQLIDEEGNLTSSGKDAMKPKQFNTVLRNQIKNYFELFSLDLSSLNDHISSCWASDNVTMESLPTSEKLYELMECPDELKPETFSRLLTLLAHCDSAVFSQRKIFLNVKS